MFQAMFSILFETGVRPGELLSIQIKDVFFSGVKAKLYVRGKTEKKTGSRPVYIYQRSIEHLKHWLNIHPLRSSPDAPLWITNHKKPFPSDHFGKIYYQTSKKAGLVKKNWPYLARHTRLTQFYRDYGSIIGAKLAGHVPGSREVRTYLHLSDMDIESALDDAHGVPSEKKAVSEQKCVCGCINPYGEIICQACGSALNSGGAFIVEKKQEQELKQLEELRTLLMDKQIMTILQAMKTPEMIVALKQMIK
jgi:hypothetical protein